MTFVLSIVIISLSYTWHTVDIWITLWARTLNKAKEPYLAFYICLLKLLMGWMSEVWSLIRILLQWSKVNVWGGCDTNTELCTHFTSYTTCYSLHAKSATSVCWFTTDFAGFAKKKKDRRGVHGVTEEEQGKKMQLNKYAMWFKNTPDAMCGGRCLLVCVGNCAPMCFVHRWGKKGKLLSCLFPL